MSLIPNLGPGSPVLKLVERAVTALERIADELHTANEARDLELNGPRDYR